MEFFSRKLVKVFLFGIATCFSLGVFIASISLKTVKKISFPVGFYYLVSDEAYTEASTHLTQLSGGAGYTLSHEGRS